eukprot:837697-Amphidinium_carterae.1
MNNEFEFELVNEYREMDENTETMEYNEYVQTMMFCSETDDVTVRMIKMNIKLPNLTLFDGKSPQFNEWAEEVKSYLT